MTTPTAVSGSRSIRWLLLAIFSVSTILGVVAFWRYRQSEKHIRASVTAFDRRGSELSVERCVDEVLDWTERCSAIIGLCDASVSRMMNACFQGRDRSAYCAQLGTATTADTRFGHAECKRRGVKRRTKKACAAAYRMIAARCDLLREKPAQASAR